MKEIMSSILTVLLYISLFADYGLGVVHSFKKHGVADGIIGTALFPWAMYRGIEFWWHDDYANVNWDKRLTNDVQTCIYFISSSNDENADKYQINENLEKFSDKIKNYPEDKKRFLHDATKNYILFSNSITKDIFNSLSKYKTTGDYNLIESSETLKLERELSNFKLKEEIDLYKKGFEELNKKMKSNLSNDTTLIDFDRIKEMETSMNYKVEIQQKEFRRIFKTLFNEDL
jgi:hypothetical protein